MNTKNFTLCTANIGLYVPIDFMRIPDNVQTGLMIFKSKFINMTKANYPEIDFSKKNFRENLLLFIDICYDCDKKKYEAEYSVEMEAWFAEPANGKVIYYDNSSEGFGLKLSDEDAKQIKKIVLQKLTEALH